VSRDQDRDLVPTSGKVDGRARAASGDEHLRGVRDYAPDLLKGLWFGYYSSSRS